jgi:pyruvate dehydrogenase (quinone)
VLAIASHIPSTQIGTGYFQETHPETLFAECSHYSELISRPEQMPRLLRIAIQHALGKGGVAVLSLPGDVSALPAGNPTAHSDLVSGRPTVVPPRGQIKQLALRLNQARKVTLFAGAGVWNARDEVLALAGRSCRCPATAAWRC